MLCLEFQAGTDLGGRGGADAKMVLGFAHWHNWHSAVVVIASGRSGPVFRTTRLSICGGEIYHGFPAFSYPTAQPTASTPSLDINDVSVP